MIERHGKNGAIYSLNFSSLINFVNSTNSELCIAYFKRKKLQLSNLFLLSKLKVYIGILDYLILFKFHTRCMSNMGSYGKWKYSTKL